MLNPHRLRFLVELHRLGTVTAVAKALAYSPSTVSQQLALLDREVGVSLTERVGRRLRLTAAGDVLAHQGRLVLDQIERAEHALSGFVPVAVTVAAFPTAARALVLPTIERHPHVTVNLVVLEPEQAIPGLLAGVVDLVIAEEYPDQNAPGDRRLHHTPLLRDPLWLVSSETSPTTLRDLAAHRWVLEPPESASRQWAMLQCRRAGFDPQVAHEASDLSLHADLIAMGHAAGFLPGLLPRPANVTYHEICGHRRLVLSTRSTMGASPQLAEVVDTMVDTARSISR